MVDLQETTKNSVFGITTDDLLQSLDGSQNTVLAHTESKSNYVLVKLGIK